MVLFSTSGGTHRVRGVMVAVGVLGPVESTSPPQLFEQQFPSTPLLRVWQERLCKFRRPEILRNESNVSIVLSERYGKHLAAGLLNEKAFTKLIATDEHFGRAVPREQI